MKNKRHTNVAEILACFFGTLNKRLLTLTHPDTRIVVLQMSQKSTAIRRNKTITHLLIGLVGSFRVTNLLEQVVLLVQDEVTDTTEIRELGISIDVHFYHTVANGGGNFLLGGSRSTVEDKVPG